MTCNELGCSVKHDSRFFDSSLSMCLESPIICVTMEKVRRCRDLQCTHAIPILSGSANIFTLSESGCTEKHCWRNAPLLNILAIKIMRVYILNVGLDEF